jgi:hypothetical protein
MNIHRATEIVRKANLALQQKHFFSAEQLKAFRKARARANKFIKAFTHPTAPALPRPTNHYHA